jgi:hypothetical protein
MPIRLDPRLSGQARFLACPCGSGKKTKRCHGAAQAKELRKRMAQVPKGQVLCLVPKDPST